MKKLLSLSLAVLLLMSMFVMPASAAQEVSVYLFGEKLEFDVPPQIINGRTLVPMRKIFESLGYEVDWEKETKTAIAVSIERTIRITIDSYTMYVNDEEKALDVPACIIDGRTMVPARAISEASGYKVDWDKDTKTVIITNSNALDHRPVGKIGDFEVSQAFYNVCFYDNSSQYAQYEMYYGENWMDAPMGEGTIGDAIISGTKSDIELLVICSALAEKHYGITSDTVKSLTSQNMASVVASCGGRDGFDQFLFEINATEIALETYFSLVNITNLLVEKETEIGKITSVSDNAAEELFNQEYANKVKVQHILVSTESLDGYTPAKTDAEAKAIVNEILTKLKQGEDFGKLIELYNEDPGQSPDGYYVFGDGEMVKEFETASKKLIVGKYTTQAVKTAYGYHIIKRYSLDKTSEEFKNCKATLVQEALINALQTEEKNISIDWGF